MSAGAVASAARFAVLAGIARQLADREVRDEILEIG
jgi:hypothetical protein